MRPMQRNKRLVLLQLVVLGVIWYGVYRLMRAEHQAERAAAGGHPRHASSPTC
jgi:uncharacterized membrane protein